MATWALIIIVALFSVFSVLLSAIDKSRARKGGRRVSEATLFTFAALGGATFMFVTMIVIHHKTKHMKFMIGLPLMILYHALLAYMIIA